MWFILGLAVGITLFLAFWLNRRGVHITWYEWLLMVVGIVLILFGIQNYQAAVSDFEPNAPGAFLLLFAVPGLILFIAGAILAWWGYSRKSRAGQAATDASTVAET